MAQNGCLGRNEQSVPGGFKFILPPVFFFYVEYFDYVISQWILCIISFAILQEQATKIVHGESAVKPKKILTIF